MWWAIVSELQCVCLNTTWDLWTQCIPLWKYGLDKYKCQKKLWFQLFFTENKMNSSNDSAREKLYKTEQFNMHSSETSPNFPLRLMLRGLSSEHCGSISLSLFLSPYPLIASLPRLYVHCSNLSLWQQTTIAKTFCQIIFVFSLLFAFLWILQAYTPGFPIAFRLSYITQAYIEHRARTKIICWFNYINNILYIRFCNWLLTFMMPTSMPL